MTNAKRTGESAHEAFALFRQAATSSIKTAPRFQSSRTPCVAVCVAIALCITDSTSAPPQTPEDTLGVFRAIAYSLDSDSILDVVTQASCDQSIAACELLDGQSWSVIRGHEHLVALASELGANTVEDLTAGMPACPWTEGTRRGFRISFGPPRIWRDSAAVRATLSCRHKGISENGPVQRGDPANHGEVFILRKHSGRWQVVSRQRTWYSRRLQQRTLNRNTTLPIAGAARSVFSPTPHQIPSTRDYGPAVDFPTTHGSGCRSNRPDSPAIGM